MSHNNKIVISIIGFISLIILLNSFFVLDQRQSALVVQFGEPIRHVTEPGLKFKVPMVQDVLFFDNRIQNLYADTTEVIAADQKTMRVDAFTKYRIVDVLKFYQRVKDEKGLKARLAPILESSLRQVLGNAPFKASLTPERAAMMLKIKQIVKQEAADFGVEIIDARIMRADLPDRSREAVYDRMKSEREKEAKEIRAEGAEHGQKIIATAAKDKQIILAEAKKKGEITRGEGDGLAIKSFAAAFNKDPEFYDFYRTMQAYRKSINSDTSRMIMSQDTEFMKYFKKSR